MAGGTKPKHDYDTMYLEYIKSDVSYRQLAERHGASFSAVTRYGRAHGWDAKREQYKQLENEKAIEKLADKRAAKIAEIETDFFDVLHGSILKMGIDIQDHWETDEKTGQRVFVPGQQVTPEGLTKLIDKYLVMTGNVTDRRAHLGVNIGATADPSNLPRDVLRGLRDLATEQGAGEGSMGQSPIPRIAGAKQVN